MSVSRRDFLKSSGVAGLSAATISMLPASIQKALAVPANNRTGTIRDVEHVVILMQENRSFDSFFGTFKGVRGFGDRFTIPLDGNRTVWQQKNLFGRQIMPYRLDQTKGNAQRNLGAPHTWPDSKKAWDMGRMGSWPAAKLDHSMIYFGEQEIPFHWALAEAFTLCDGYFCSMHGGTNPNRLFFWTGTNGATANPPQVALENYWWDLKKGTVDGGYKWKTYPERLEEAGVSWLVYQNMPENYGCNSLVGFEQYRKANIESGAPVWHDVKKGEENPPYDPEIGQRVPLYKGIANTMPDGGMLQALRDDVMNDRLPQVSWVVAPATYSEHPGPSSPVQGSWYTQEVLNALTSNEEVWSKTVLFVTYDENDGYFDHVPPPVVPSRETVNGEVIQHGKTTLDNSDLDTEYYTQPRIKEALLMSNPDGEAYGPGPRVPMFVISPWSRGGWVNSQYFDHTSVLRFLETRFGPAEENISAYRRMMFGDLTSAFNFKTPNNEPMPQLAGQRSRDDADKLRKSQSLKLPIVVPIKQTKPQQEQGQRPSRALPYRLHTTSVVRDSGATLKFSNTGTQACVFHVYNKLNLKAVPRRYGIGPGKILQDQWQLDDKGNYDLWVLSNNGYHRHFTGNANTDPQAEIQVKYVLPKGDIIVSLYNDTDQALTFVIVPKAYYGAETAKTVVVQPGSNKDIRFDLNNSQRWYDFEVTLQDKADWMRRFAGRVENGEHSVTDPAMGTE